jgi:hypothetical protein
LKIKDGEEIHGAGRAFYWTPGHAPHAREDAEYVIFSPTSTFNAFIDQFKAQVG